MKTRSKTLIAAATAAALCGFLTYNLQPPSQNQAKRALIRTALVSNESEFTVIDIKGGRIADNQYLFQLHPEALLTQGLVWRTTKDEEWGMLFDHVRSIVHPYASEVTDWNQLRVALWIAPNSCDMLTLIELSDGTRFIILQAS